MREAPVQFDAPPGFARMDERTSLKLNLHMTAISSMLAYAASICQSQLHHRVFQFPAVGNVSVRHGRDNTDITVLANGCKVMYQYHYARQQISLCSRYDDKGNVLESDFSTVKASYEAILDYCTTVLAERMDLPDVASSTVEEEPVTETN